MHGPDECAHAVQLFGLVEKVRGRGRARARARARVRVRVRPRREGAYCSTFTFAHGGEGALGLVATTYKVSTTTSYLLQYAPLPATPYLH